MGEANLELRIALEHATEHEACCGDRGVERIADQVREIVGREPIGARHVDGMQQDESIEFRSRGPNRLELRIVEVFARDVRSDLRPAQPQHPHCVTQFVRRLFWRLHRQGRNRKKPVRARPGELGERFVLDACKSRREGSRLPIEERLRAHREHLHVDFGCSHVLQALLEIPSAAGKMPIDVSGHVEPGELLADVRKPRPHCGRFTLHQPDRLFGEDVRVNVDRLHRLGDHGICCS